MCLPDFNSRSTLFVGSVPVTRDPDAWKEVRQRNWGCMSYELGVQRNLPRDSNRRDACFLAQPICRNMLGNLHTKFVPYFWRSLKGLVLEDYLGTFLKTSGTRANFRGSKLEICEGSVLVKAGPLTFAKV